MRARDAVIQGSAWSVDLKDFTSALYSTLFHSIIRSAPSDAAVHNPQEARDQFSGLLTTLKTVLIDNRQLSLSRVDAFIKRCMLTAAHAPQHIALAVLAFSHALVLKYPKSSHLFSSESGGAPSPNGGRAMMPQRNLCDLPCWRVNCFCDLMSKT